MTHASEKLVADLFRKEYGKIVAVITKTFGSEHLQLAEDITQDTLIAAMEHWATDKVPDNPQGWLMRVAKNKALNAIKHGAFVSSSAEIPERSSQHPDDIVLETEVGDSQLRMIFTCCHPSISTEMQLALILKTIGGFGVSEVARALLTSESTINKRLYRARKAIREAHIPFEIPQGEQLTSRLETVLLSLYLLFNEGYKPTAGLAAIREELCFEAVRLNQLLIERFPFEKSLYAFEALMHFHIARFDTRIDQNGALITLEYQDRRLWKNEWIKQGFRALKKSMGAQTPSSYHLEAGIAAEHCLAETFEETNWKMVYQLYELLFRLKRNAVIELNMAIAIGYLKEPERAIERLDEIERKGSLKGYNLLPATRGHFLLKMGRKEEAIDSFLEALSLTTSPLETLFIKKRIALCNEYKGPQK